MDERALRTEQAWRNIVDWCRTHAPLTADALHGPANGEALAAAEDEMGLEWPSQLVAWLRVADGADRSEAARLIPPLFIPLGVDLIMNTWRMMMQITDRLFDEEAIRGLEAQPAGSGSHAFLRCFIPIGDDTCGDFLFVDLRSGSGHGSICQWEDGAAYPRPLLWEDIASMAQDVAEGLRRGRWPAGDKVALVEDGRFTWDDTPGWETLRAPEGPSTLDELEARLAELAEERRRAKEWRRRSGGPESG